MGSKLQDMAATPMRMIGSAMERLPAMPSRKKEKPSKLKIVRRVVEGAGTVVSVALTGWEVYEIVRSAGGERASSKGSRSGASGSRKSSGSKGSRSSNGRKSSGAKRSTSTSKSTSGSSTRSRTKAA